MIITIDGATGVGKTTTAKALSEKLGYRHLVGGIFFRSLTYSCIQNRVNDESGVIDIANIVNPEIRLNSGQSRIFLDGADVTDFLWKEDVNDLVPSIANFDRVRKIRIDWLRNYAGNMDVVADGRTLGTEVFPNADHKFYLKCDLIARMRLLNDRQPDAVYQQKELDLISLRDRRDKEANIDKFKVPADAHLLDTTELTLDGVVAKILSILKRS